MMLERVIKQFLDIGIDWYFSDPRRYERFLINELGIGESEAHKARIFFAGDGKPTVMVGYARSTGPFPCIAITLASDNTRQRVLGGDMGPAGVLIDSEGEEEDEEFVNEDNQTAEGRIWFISPRYDLWFYVFDNADICLYYYYLVRHIILSGLDDLLTGDLEDIELTGADMAPDPRFLPENIFVRRLTITGLAQEKAWRAQLRGTSIDGLTHEDTGGGIAPYDPSS